MAVSTPARRSPLAILIFVLALLGVLDVVNIHFQKEAGFANGCTGAESFDPSAALSGGSAAGCATVTASEYASVAGIDNVVLGLIFYGLVVALRLAYAATGNDRLRLASFGVVAVGFVYELWLVYIQAFVLHEFCTLCMISAGIVLLLLVTHVMEHTRARGAAPAPRSGALRPYLVTLAVFAVALVGMTAVARSRADERPVTPPDDRGVVAETPPVNPADTAVVRDVTPATCTYDALPPVDFDRLTAGLPALGDADAPVSVVEIFDPNCPHCKHLYDLLHGTEGTPGFVETHPQARFYYVPFPLWDFSLGQVAALRIAAEEGAPRYFSLVDQLFARQGGQGMTLDQVVEAAAAAGVNGPNVRARLTDNAALQPMIEEMVAHREYVVSAVTADGRMSVPRVVINGRPVLPDPALGYTADCLNTLISEAVSGGTQTPPVAAPTPTAEQ